MKKYAFFIFILLCALLFLACKKQNTIDPLLFDVGDDEIVNPVFYTELRETFEISKNVFSGEVISFEYEYFNSKKTVGNINFIIKVNAVYKGEYIQNEIVEEIYSIGHFDKNIESENFFEKGQKYFFMLGIDESLNNKEEVQNLLYHSYYRGIKLCANGMMEGTVDNIHFYGRNTYPEMISFLLDLEEQIGWAYCDLYYSYGDLGYDPESDNSMGEAFDISDDVYIGEILESKVIGVVGSTSAELYQIKVKVISVFKGNYIPGEIVEDISFVERRYGDAPIDDSVAFLCTGEVIDNICKDSCFSANQSWTFYKASHFIEVVSEKLLHSKIQHREKVMKKVEEYLRTGG